MRPSTPSSPCGAPGTLAARSRRSSEPFARPRESRCTRRSGRWSMTKREFWKSAGMHLLERGAEGWLQVTPDFLRAYYTRPEVHPIDTSCAAEMGLHDDLIADPLRRIHAPRLAALPDAEVAENYRRGAAVLDGMMRARVVHGAHRA